MQVARAHGRIGLTHVDFQLIDKGCLEDLGCLCRRLAQLDCALSSFGRAAGEDSILLGGLRAHAPLFIQLHDGAYELVEVDLSGTLGIPEEHPIGDLNLGCLRLDAPDGERELAAVDELVT